MSLILLFLGEGSGEPAPVVPSPIGFGAYVRCLIGDQLGRVEAEVQPELGPILWRYNDMGQVKLKFTIRDPLFRKELIRFGGRVLLQFSNGLPDWGGVFDPPERWTADGVIETTAYEAGHLLAFRRTAKRKRFVNVTAGAILTAIMDEAAATSETGILLGSVWQGGDLHRVEYNYAPLLDVLRKSICGELSEADWDVRPVYSNGHISFYLNLYEQRGTPKRNVCLIEGHNAEIDYQRVGNITNQWYVAGSGSDWSSTRKVGFAYDPLSIGSYGLREGLRIESGVNVTARLNTQAQLLLNESKRPRIQLGSLCVDRQPAAFADYDTGDTIQVMSHSVGFSGDVVVMAREYDPRSNLCKNVIESVTD